MEKDRVAGKPKTNQLIQAVEDFIGFDTVFERIAGGETVASLVRDLGEKMKGKYQDIYNPSTFQRLLYTKQFRTRLSEAKKTSADVHVDSTDEVLEKIKTGNMAVNVGRAIMDGNLMQMKAKNREKYGDKGNSVIVNNNTNNAMLGSEFFNQLKGIDRTKLEEAEVTEVKELSPKEGANDDFSSG